MRYPTLPIADARRLAPQFLADGPQLLENEIVWAGSGEEIPLGHVPALAERVAAELDIFKASDDAGDRDLLEGRMSGLLHAELRELPIMTLDDAAFWRFLSFQYFWTFAVWREQKTFDKGDAGKYLRYVDGTNVSECVLTRMFLRGQITLEDGGDYQLAWAVPEATDFWRSHIVRVRTGTAPRLARAFVREQAERRMKTDPLRAYARRLNRLGTNLVLPMIDDDQAASIIQGLRDIESP